MNQRGLMMNTGEWSMSCCSETNSSSTIYTNSMAAATRSSGDDISLSLLFNLSTIQDKVHEIQSLVNFFMISPSNNNQSWESTSSLAAANVESLVQDIITAASSMMLTCQSLQISTGDNSNIDTSQTTDGTFMEFSQDFDPGHDFVQESSTNLLGVRDFDPDHDFLQESSSNLLGVQEREHVSLIDQSLDWHSIQTSNPKTDHHYFKSRTGNYEIVELSVEDLLAKYTHYCQICGKGFKRDANLRMHMRAHGDEYKTREALINPTSRDKNVEYSSLTRHYYSCPQHGCRWNQRHDKFQPLKSVICAKNHYKRSHCPKIYMCRRCNVKHFSVLSDLRTHEKHCGDIKWVCSCGTRFSRKDKLTSHVSLFSGHSPAHEPPPQPPMISL
ncbi:protein SENSITIVE TO PROTON RHIZOTOXICITY 2-like [Brassica rapa]|uniref:protein SENSITIVE TO PROTON RHIZOTOXICITY 2-like n=1 Tax=Brassica napus TaxID=3708 RepID=UPI00142D5B76|nr:protein SENSITIVE TO PROTON RHIZOTOXICITY 2-like [Brassica napus]XP_033138033.1 protein SENSITIVE TO PROTON RHIZOTOXICITY 2-like [Brassica rapa]